MQNARLDESQAGIKIARRNSNNLRYAHDTTIMAEIKGKLKRFLMRWKESEKASLKLNIQKTKIMTSGPITSWQIEGEKVKAVKNFIFLSSKITMEGDCSHEFKRCLLHGRKNMTNIDSRLKSRDITLPIKVCLVKAVVFTVVMYGCELVHIEGWTSRNWCFHILLLEKTFEISWTARKSNQSTMKETNCMFIGKIVANIEASLLWSSDLKNWLIRKDPDAGKDWRQKQKRMVEDEMDFCPRDLLTRILGVGCHFLFQVIFPTQGLNPHPLGLLYFWWILYPLSHPASPNLSILVHKELSYSF